MAMKLRIWLPIGALLALLAVGAVGGYVYFFSGLRTSPSALTLPSPSPSPSASATATPSSTPSATSTGGAGTWTVASGSIAGYRVKEQFVGQSSTHEAVARTSGVSGSLTVTQNGTAYQLSAATITVQLSGLASVDSVAGYNVTNRDRIVQQALDVSSFQPRPSSRRRSRSPRAPPQVRR